MHKRFHKYYHPYLPIVPRRSFERESLQFLASHEPHLLTAMITVAARDLPDGEDILRTCSSYMHQLVSQISAGKKCDVEAVEALLLLAEWEPQDSLSDAKEVGCGEEDRAAWMHVGLALRIGYFLGLDRTAIKHDDEEKAAHFNRRRVTWAGNVPHTFQDSLLISIQFATFQIDNFQLASVVLFGPVALLLLLAWDDTDDRHSTNSLHYNRKHRTRLTMQVFCKLIWI